MRAANLGWKVKKVPLYAWGDGIAYPIDGSFPFVPEDRWGKEKCPTFRTPDIPPRTLGNSTYLRTWVRT